MNNSTDENGDPVVVARTRSSTEIREDYESLVRDGYNRKLAEREAAYTVTEVSLVKESDNKYSGFARFSDGDSIRVEVLVDEDGKAIWRSGR